MTKMTGYMRIGVIGEPGCGKTLILVGVGKFMYDRGVDVYSNFEVKFPHYKIEDPNDIDKIHDGFFLADDFGAWCDSRLSQSKKNILVTRILGHSRKSHYGFIWSCQVPSQIDLRIRYISTHLFTPYVDNYDHPTRVFLQGVMLHQLDWIPMRMCVWNVVALGQYYDTDARIYGDNGGYAK